MTTSWCRAGLARRIAGGLAITWLAAAAADARIHSLSGNARFQLGAGLPIPVGTTAAPVGKVLATPGATIRQHGVHVPFLSPAKVVLDPGQLAAPASPTAFGIFVTNPARFQVQTALSVAFPRSKVSFRAGGRTGAATVTFCPGEVVTASGNPGCTISAPAIPGLLRYTSTSSQFGGAARASVGGSANIALRVSSPAPCAFSGTNPGCLALFVLATPPSSPAWGGPFGSVVTTSRPALSPGLYLATVTALGLVTGAVTFVGPGIPFPATTYGGPWTTGRVTVSVTAAVPPQIFILSGFDARSGSQGIGGLSLVSGGVTQSSLGGAGGQRGWLNLVVGPVISAVPAWPAYGTPAAVGLLALGAAWGLRRRAR